MAKASNKETAQRIAKLQELTLKGRSNTACVEFARQTWWVSRSQAYKLLMRAWDQTYNDILITTTEGYNDIEQVDVSRQKLVAWAISQLQEATGITREQRNIGAVVGCIRELDHLVKGAIMRVAPSID